MKLTGLAEVLPGKPVSNHEMAERFGLHERWMDRMTGNRTRYFCDLDGADNTPRNTGDLATLAGTRALQAAGVEPGDLDFLILTTGSPDALMPATVNLVADRLGINAVPTFQLTSGCAGALQGMYTARALLSTGLKRGLVIGADSVVKLWPVGGKGQPMKPAEMANFALFGDGAGAVVVEIGNGSSGTVIDHIVLKTLGRGRKSAQVVRWYGADGAPMVPGPGGKQVRESMGEEDYRAIAEHVPDLAADLLKELLEISGWELADIDRVLVPQLNGVMSEMIRKHLGVATTQDASCVAETGNSGNALPFIQLTRALRALDEDADRPGGVGGERKVLLTSVESSKWIVAGLVLRHRAA